MSNSTKQTVFIVAVVFGMLHLWSLATLLIFGDATPLVGALIGDLVIGALIGLFRLAERLFPGDPS